MTIWWSSLSWLLGNCGLMTVLVPTFCMFVSTLQSENEENAPSTGTQQTKKKWTTRCQTLWCKRRYQRQTHRQPGGCHYIWTNQRPTSLIPHFYARCPSCLNPPNLSWLETGTKRAGLHTQWRGLHTQRLGFVLGKTMNN